MLLIIIDAVDDDDRPILHLTVLTTDETAVLSTVLASLTAVDILLHGQTAPPHCLSDRRVTARRTRQ